MANWKYTLNFLPFFNNEEISIQEKGKLVANEIKKVFPNQWLNYSSEDYVDELIEMVENFEEVEEVEIFDDLLNELYNFGDTEVAPFNQWPENRMAWIKTI